MTGTLETVDGNPALRFERRLAYPVERVWRAISEPAELARWFVAPVEWTPATGETFESIGEPGEVTEASPPRRLAWTWGGDRFSFELEPAGDGCLLVFVHVFADRSLGAQHAAGWELHLGRLDGHLAGGFVPQEELLEQFAEVHEAYAERFGLDPEVGRHAFEEHRRERADGG